MAKTILTFVLFFIVALALYLPTSGAGFVTDQIGWLQTYNHYGVKGILTAYGDKSFHFFYHIVNYSAWRLFGLNGTAWTVLFIFLHALAATLSFRLFNILFAPIAKGSLIAFVGALLFLVSPYQTEAMAWYACIHYLVCACLVLLALISFVEYSLTGAKKHLLIYYAAFVASVFTLEISFAVPLIILVLVLFYPSRRNISKQHLIGLYVLPSLVPIAAFFLINKLLKGNFAGHYGAAVHFNANPLLLVSNLSKYISKIFLFTQFLSYDLRSHIYLLYEKPKFICATSLIALIGIYIYLAKRNIWSAGTKILFALLLCFIVSLAPVINLYFYYIGNIEGDRFAYFPAIFAANILAFICIKYFKRLGVPLVILLFFINVYFLRINVKSWHQSMRINQSLISSFHYYNAPRIYFLNLPDNYKGAYMLRSFADDNAFGEMLALYKGVDIESRMGIIMQYNMAKATDGVSVEVADSTTLKVKFNQWGNWWWRGGIGAGGYETAGYIVTIADWGGEYTVKFKNKIPNASYLYQQGGTWYNVQGF